MHSLLEKPLWQLSRSGHCAVTGYTHAVFHRQVSSGRESRVCIPSVASQLMVFSLFAVCKEHLKIVFLLTLLFWNIERP